MIIGGYCDGIVSSLIAKYTIDKWERIGNLQQARRSHRTIENDDRIYIVGGLDSGVIGASILYVFLYSIILNVNPGKQVFIQQNGNLVARWKR